MIHQYRTDALC